MLPLKEIPAVYNIDSGYSFADALVKGLLDRVGDNPLELAKYTLLLPTHRACRALREAFLRHSKGGSLILPAMHALGEVDADEMTLLLAEEDDFQAGFDIPPAVSKLERQLLLAQIIRKSGKAHNFDQAVALALELGSFLDEVQTERLSFDDLSKLVPEEFAGHWQKTLEFLKILTNFWPEILKERGLIDIAERRNLLIEMQIKAWRKNPPQNRIIAAGSTGPIPAAAELLALVSVLPQGELVLPGLDKTLDDSSWDKVDEDHPQFFIKRLLKNIGIDRNDVKEWQLTEPYPINQPRVKLLSETMRPADTTDKWRQLTLNDIPEHALHGLSRIDCSSPQEEADVIALIMREALQTPEKTCALITSDRRLARRVTQSLKRWDINIDDSGGQPLTEFPIGSYLMLIAEMAESNLAPVTMLAFLKHPLLATAIAPDELRDMVQFLDEYVLRGPRHAGGFAGLRAAAGKLDNKTLFDWLDKLENTVSSFLEQMSPSGEKAFYKLLTEHIKTAEDLASTRDDHGASRLWRGEAGEAAAQFLKNLLRFSRELPLMSAEHYVSVFGMLIKTNTVRPRYGMHPRLSILGQIEARLYCADMVILGGLNEGTWPKLPEGDPWMSRPMRKQFGLPSPEKDISLSAHDFVQAASAAEVIITRAKKQDGTPTVPARWLLRMETVLNATDPDIVIADGRKYLHWVKKLDEPEVIKPVSRPAPCPPVSSRPDRLSVTKIESWMRDPYQIYARYILNLKALDPLDADAGGAERGTFIHAALEKFVKTYEDKMPDDAEEKLLQFGREALDEVRVSKEVEAFWWPRFEKIINKFVEQECFWRASAKPYLAETAGEIQITVNNKAFTISGKADRIDKMQDGSYAIIDYKSGYVPDNTSVAAGLSPQLPLEAMILEQGGFDAVGEGKVSELIYWKVTGSGQEPVKMQKVAPQGYTVENMIADAENGLKALVEHFDDPATPYLSYPRANAKPKFSDYEHLSRIKEWGISGDDSDEGED